MLHFQNGRLGGESTDHFGPQSFNQEVEKTAIPFFSEESPTQNGAAYHGSRHEVLQSVSCG